MLLLLPGNPKSLLLALDYNPDPAIYGLLLTPRRTATKAGLHSLKYAVDNECFTGGFTRKRFCRALLRIRRVHGVGDCLFVVAPDIVGDAKRTLRRFYAWQRAISGLSFPVALAGQDGLEDLDIPWGLMDALFIGGSTRWKLSQSAADLIIEAKERRLWTHMGRVNSTYRVSRLREWPDSIDGTAWARHPTKYALMWQRWHEAGMPAFTGNLC